VVDYGSSHSLLNSSILAAWITAAASKEDGFSLREEFAPFSQTRISRNYKALSATLPAISIAYDSAKPSLSKITPFAKYRLTK